MAFQITASADGTQRRFSFVGQRCLALNGVTAEAVMADPDLLYTMILPEHREVFARVENEAAAAMKPFDLEVAMRRADGEVRWHRIASMPRMQADGTVLWDGLQIDVTDRRIMAAELEAQRNRLEMAVETTGLGLWEWDLGASEVTWSPRNRELFGVGPDYPVTLDGYLSFIHPDDLDRVRNAYLAARDAGEDADFAVEHRIITAGGEERWLLVHGRVIADDNGPRRAIGTSLDVTQRRTAEEHQILLMGELAHRSKNGMLVMQAMVSQAARSAETVAEFAEVLNARIQAMATSQDLVTQAGGRPVKLSELLGQVLTPFDLNRFDLDPALETLTVAQETAIGLALLSHEMGTNAVKYGALSNPKGRVTIARERAPDGLAAIHWRELDGPQVLLTNRRGFGSRLIDSVLRDRGGKVEAVFAPDGFSAHVEFRAEAV
jgi:PAS domain S-box-containing protein